MTERTMKIAPDLRKELSKGPITPIAVKFSTDIDFYEGLKDIEALNLVTERAVSLPNNLNMISLVGNLSIAKSLAKLPNVENVMFDRPMHILAGGWNFPLLNATQDRAEMRKEPSEYILDTHTIRNLVGADLAEEVGITGKGIKCAVLDTGFWLNPIIYKNKRPMVKTPNDLNDGNGHGSHVAGIMFCPEYTYPNGLTVRGISPDISLYVDKVLHTPLGTGSSIFIAEGLQKAYEWGADLVNMSLGSEVDYDNYLAENDPLALAVEAVHSEGTLSICAVGNSGPDGHPGSPAVAKHSISVGSWSHKYQQVAYFSSRGSSPDGQRELPHLYGLGGGAPSIDDEQELVASPLMRGALLDILGGLPDGLGTIMGSSQATPGVCSILALMWQKKLEAFDKDLSYKDVIQLSKLPQNILKWEHWEQYENSMQNPL